MPDGATQPPSNPHRFNTHIRGRGCALGEHVNLGLPRALDVRLRLLGVADKGADIVVQGAVGSGHAVDGSLGAEAVAALASLGPGSHQTLAHGPAAARLSWRRLPVKVARRKGRVHVDGGYHVAVESINRHCVAVSGGRLVQGLRRQGAAAAYRTAQGAPRICCMRPGARRYRRP